MVAFHASKLWTRQYQHLLAREDGRKWANPRISRQTTPKLCGGVPHVEDKEHSLVSHMGVCISGGKWRLSNRRLSSLRKTTFGGARWMTAGKRVTNASHPSRWLARR